MVKDAIQEDAETKAMRFLREGRKEAVGSREILRVRAPLLIARRIQVVRGIRREHLAAVLRNNGEVRVDVLIILGVVLVIRGRDKERIKVDDLDAEIFQIGKLFPHPVQVAAVKITDIEGRGLLIPIFDVLHRQADVDVLIRIHVVFRTAVPEAIHKNLVHNRALGPLRCPKTRNMLKRELGPRERACAAPVVKEALTALPVFNQKQPGDCLLRRKGTGIVAEASSAADRQEFCFLFPLLQNHAHTKLVV